MNKILFSFEIYKRNLEHPKICSNVITMNVWHYFFQKSNCFLDVLVVRLGFGIVRDDAREGLQAGHGRELLY